MQRRCGLTGNIPVFLALALIPFMCGCSTLTIPNPDEIIQKPLGTESIRVGMTKDEVASIWGKPDNITTVENKQKWSTPREVWTYHARYGAIPIDAGYLSKTQKLYFDGDNLTEITD